MSLNAFQFANVTIASIVDRICERGDARLTLNLQAARWGSVVRNAAKGAK